MKRAYDNVSHQVNAIVHINNFGFFPRDILFYEALPRCHSFTGATFTVNLSFPSRLLFRDSSPEEPICGARIPHSLD